MTLNNSLDLLYFILAVAAVWIGGAITWLIIEAAIMAHRANRVMKTTLGKLARFERAVMSIKDRIESSAGYFGALAEGGRTLMGFLNDRKGRSKPSRRRRKDEEDEDEDA